MKAEGTVCLLELELLKSATILQIFGPARLPADVLAGHLGINLAGPVPRTLSEV
jgi:hypothetical protein